MKHKWVNYQERGAFGRCVEHLNKLIFYTEEQVFEHNKHSTPWIEVQAYPCPIKGKDHLHSRQLQKRRKRNNQRKKDKKTWP